MKIFIDSTLSGNNISKTVSNTMTQSPEAIDMLSTNVVEGLSEYGNMANTYMKLQKLKIILTSSKELLIIMIILFLIIMLIITYIKLSYSRYPRYWWLSHTINLEANLQEFNETISDFVLTSIDLEYNTPRYIYNALIIKKFRKLRNIHNRIVNYVSVIVLQNYKNKNVGKLENLIINNTNEDSLKNYWTRKNKNYTRINNFLQNKDDKVKGKTLNEVIPAILNNRFESSKNVKDGTKEDSEFLYTQFKKITKLKNTIHNYFENNFYNFIDYDNISDLENNKTLIKYGKYYNLNELLNSSKKYIHTHEHGHVTHEDLVHTHEHEHIVSDITQIEGILKNFPGSSEINTTELINDLINFIINIINSKYNIEYENFIDYERYKNDSSKSSTQLTLFINNKNNTIILYDKVIEIKNKITTILSSSDYSPLYDELYVEYETFILTTKDNNDLNLFNDDETNRLMNKYQNILDILYKTDYDDEIENAIKFVLRYNIDDNPDKDKKLGNLLNYTTKLFDLMLYIEYYLETYDNYDMRRKPTISELKKLYKKHIDRSVNFYFMEGFINQWSDLFKLDHPSHLKWMVKWIRDIIPTYSELGDFLKRNI